MKFIDGVVVERVGEEIVLLTPEKQVIRLSGDSADSARRLLDDPSAVTQADTALLVATGLVEESSSSVSRRGVVLGGAALAGGGVLALSLPVAAAASSPAGGIWGFYAAALSSSTNQNLVLFAVFIDPAVYDTNRDSLGLPADAGWPTSLDPADSWSLTVGGKTFALELRDAEGGEIEQASLGFQLAENQTSTWDQDLFDLLSPGYDAEEIVQAPITNGVVTVTVSFVPVT